MTEAFSHREGQLFVWTGTATASALVAFAQGVQANVVRGWLNEPRGDLSYRDVQTGQRLDVQIGTLLTWDMTLQRLFDSATALHMHFKESGLYGSAGWFWYSGRLDSLTLNSQEGGLVNFAAAGHFNRWSAYGSG